MPRRTLFPEFAFHALKIKHLIRRLACALRLPDGFGQAFEQRMLGVVRRAAACGDPFELRAQAGRLIDSQLLFDCQMQ